MASKPVKLGIDIVANADGVDDGVRQAERSLGDLESAAREAEGELRDLDGLTVSPEIDADPSKAEAALKVTRDRVDELRDLIADNAVMDIDNTATLRELSKTEREVKALSKVVDTESKKIGADLDRGFEKGTRAASENTAEFRDEAKQNFSEVTSSFTGDMTGAADLLQGTLGGLASGISGPLGLALGGAAVGVGVLVTKFIEAGEKADELGEAAAEMGREFYDALPLERLDLANEKLEEFLFTSNGSGVGFWRETATSIEDLNTLFDAGIVSADAYNAILTADSPEAYAAALSTLQDNLEETYTARRTVTSLVEDETEAQTNLTRASNEHFDALERLNGSTKQAEEAATNALEVERAREEALIASGEAYRSTSGEVIDFEAAQDEATTALEAAEAALKDADDALSDYLGQLGNTRAEMDDFLDSTDALSESIKENGTDFDTNSVAARDNRDALDAVAGASADVLTSMVEQGASVDEVTEKHGALQSSLIDTLEDMGLNETQARELAEEYLGMPSDVKTLVEAEDKATSVVDDAQAAYDSLDKELVTEITADADLDSAANARWRFNDYFRRNPLSVFAQTRVSSPSSVGSGVLAPNRSALNSAPINMVRVSIAGREVSSVVRSTYDSMMSETNLNTITGSGVR